MANILEVAFYSLIVFGGLYLSWEVGWSMDVWIRKILSFRARFKATDTHLELQFGTVEEFKNYPIKKTESPVQARWYQEAERKQLGYLTHNEIRDMACTCRRCEEAYY